MLKYIVMALLLASPMAYAGQEEFLPQDVRILIFKTSKTKDESAESRILGIKDLLNCAQICKNWNLASSSNLVWEVFARSYFHNLVIPAYVQSECGACGLSLAGTLKKAALFMHRTAYTALSALQNANPNRKTLVALELSGDASVISSYISKFIAQNLIIGKTDTTLVELKALVALGSKKAAASLLELEQHSDSEESEDSE